MNSIAFGFASMLAALSWLAPNHYVPWLAFHGELLMGLAGLLALLGMQLGRPAEKSDLPALTMATLVLALVPLCQFAGGLIFYAGDAWLASGYLLAFALAQVLGQLLAARVGPAKLLERLALLFLLPAILSVGLQLYQWLRLSGLGIFAVELPPGHGPFANFAQPNQLATALFLGLVGLLYLYDRQKVGVGTAALGSLFLEFGVVMTGSRTGWLSMAVLLVWLAWSKRRVGLRLTLMGLSGLASFFLLALASWGPMSEWLLLSGGRTFGEQVQTGSRPLLWASMLDAVSRRPWFGYGWNQGLVAHGSVVIDHPSHGELFADSHNVFLDLIIWNGVPIGLASGLLIVYWLWRRVQTCHSPVQAYALAAIGVVSVHAALEYPLSYMYFLVPFGIVIGLLHATSPHPGIATLPRWSLPVMTLAAATMLGFVTYEYAQVESNTRLLRFETARIGTSRIESEAPDLWLLSQWGEHLRVARIEPRAGMTAEQLTDMKRVSQRFPYSASLLHYAEASALNGRPKEAEEALLRLCSLGTQASCHYTLQEWKAFVAAQRPPIPPVRLPMDNP